MPISHKYKLIFIHIPKCAGISVWHSLDLTISEENLISITPPILQHLLPKQLKGKYIKKEIWDTYKKFTIIRNPYDRVISDYFWMKGNAEAKRLITGTFDDFLTLREEVVNNNNYDQDVYFDHFYPMHFYFEGIQYDRVIRFENINKEYEELRQSFGIANALPHVNESDRKDFVLNKAQQDRIYKLYKKDFEQLGYEKKYAPSQPVFNQGKAGSEKEMSKEAHAQLIPANLITPLQTSKVQVFWSKEDMLFSEPESLSKNIALDSFSQNLNFNIKPGASISYLRFDIGNQIGFVNIHHILVQTINGAVVWTWNPNDIVDKNDIILIESEENFRNKTIQLSFTNDPQFVIKLPQVDQQELLVEISLSNLNAEQIAILSKTVKKPLSFYSTQDLLQFQAEKQILLQEAQTLGNKLFQLETKNAALSADVEIKEKFLAELAGNRTFLEEELKFKNELINKSLLEKEKLEQSFSSLSTEVKKLEATVFDKEKTILKNESELAQWIHAIANEREKLNQQLTLMEQLKQEKQQLHASFSDTTSRLHTAEKLILEKEKDILAAEFRATQLLSNIEQLQDTLQQERSNQLKLREEKELINRELMNDKAVWMTELNHKNEVIGHAEARLQHTENELLKAGVELKELELKVSSQQFHLSEYDRSYRELENAAAHTKQVLDEKTRRIAELERTLHVVNAETTERNRNLSNEIQNLNNQLKWYRDTYETRSLLGIVKDRVFKLFRSPSTTAQIPVTATSGLSEVERQLKWYRDTYETRSLLGIIKDRLLKFLKEGYQKNDKTPLPHLDKRVQWYRDTYETRSILGIVKDRVLKRIRLKNENNVPVKKTEVYIQPPTHTEHGDIKVSVIIPTYNRSQLLPKLLDSWKAVDKATKYKYEIIFSDDGSEDGSIEILQREKELPIIILKNDHGGASKARNAAILKARGEKLLIIGDDIFPNPEMINQHYEKLQELPVNKAVLGEVIWHRDLPVNILMKHITELGNEQFSFNAFNPHEYIDFRHFYTCNISIDRALVLSEPIIFDESFYKYGFEDIELGYRLAKKGLEIYYYPEAVGEHYHPYKIVSSFCRRQESAGEMGVVFKQLHGEDIEWAVQVDSILNLWNNYLKEIHTIPFAKDLLKNLVNICQFIENRYSLENPKVEFLLSGIYRTIFRFYYEKGVIHKKLNLDDSIYDKVFYQYRLPEIMENLRQLNALVALPNFQDIEELKREVYLAIQIHSLDQVNQLRERYKDNLHYLKFVLASEANNLSDYDFIYSPDKGFMLHERSMNQLILFLQMYPELDAVVLSFGLHDFPEIGLSQHQNNQLIRRNAVRSVEVKELQQVKVIRLIGEQSERTENWNVFFGENNFEFNSYGFFYKKSLPVFQQNSITIHKPEAKGKHKKTVFVFPTFLAVGGVEKNTVEIINYLKDQYDFVVITFERLAKAHGTLHKQFLEVCKGVYDLTELSEHDKIVNYLNALKEAYEPSTVWICNGSPWLAAHTSELRALFSDTAMVDQQVYDTDEGWVDLYKRRDTGLLQFDRFIAINSKIRNVFINAAGIDSERIDLIYSAMSVERRKLAIAKDDKELRKKFKLEPSQKYFAFIGRLTKQKSPLDLLKLIKLVVARYKGEYKFIVVGSGELGPQVEKFITDNKLSPYIVRMEFVENTFEISKISEAIVFTSLYEGLSIALLEALSVGTPAISTDVGDTKLILDEFENGLVFPKIGDINGYLTGFENFLANKDFFKRNAEKNKEKIANMFSPANIASQYATCFENAEVTVNSELV